MRSGPDAAGAWARRAPRPRAHQPHLGRQTTAVRPSLRIRRGDTGAVGMRGQVAPLGPAELHRNAPQCGGRARLRAPILDSVPARRMPHVQRDHRLLPLGDPPVRRAARCLREHGQEQQQGAAPHRSLPPSRSFGVGRNRRGGLRRHGHLGRASNDRGRLHLRVALAGYHQFDGRRARPERRQGCQTAPTEHSVVAPEQQRTCSPARWQVH